MAANDFHQLVQQYRNRIYNFARYTLRSEADAEDVTQEVLIRFWKHQRELLDGRVISWLMKVTRNACLDTIRRRTVRDRHDGGAADEHLELVASPTPDPHAEAEATDFRKRLETALDGLSEPYRSIVVLREIEGLKYDEISEAVGRPTSSVKVYLFRGRRMLREQLRELRPEHQQAATDRQTVAQRAESAPSARQVPLHA